MNCVEIQDKLSEWLDGESSPAERSLIDKHLAECAACVEVADRLRKLDQSLRAHLTPPPERTASFANRAVAALDGAVIRPKTPKNSRWIAVAAVALVLVVSISPIFLWDGDWGANHGFKAISPQIKPLPIAQLVHVIGPVSIREPAQNDWRMLQSVSADLLECPPGTHVRTAAGGLCEVVTTCGNRLRLNESTEVALVSTTDVTLVSGMLWCRAPSDCRVEMRPGQTGEDAFTNSQNPNAPLPVFSCPADAACVTTSNQNLPWEIQASAGTLEIVENGAMRELNTGEVYRIDHAGQSSRSPAGDPLSAESWMLPLLSLKAPGDAELEGWISRLLARLGESKISYLSENQLRQLGPSGAPPLLRFVQRASNPVEADRRRRAAAILSDVAPISMTGQLIELLSDADPAVRVSVAEALHRLHQEDFGISASQWETGDSQTQAAIEKWRELERQFPKAN